MARTARGANFSVETSLDLLPPESPLSSSLWATSALSVIHDGPVDHAEVQRRLVRQNSKQNVEFRELFRDEKEEKNPTAKKPPKPPTRRRKTEGKSRLHLFRNTSNTRKKNLAASESIPLPTRRPCLPGAPSLPGAPPYPACPPYPAPLLTRPPLPTRRPCLPASAERTRPRHPKDGGTLQSTPTSARHCRKPAGEPAAGPPEGPTPSRAPPFSARGRAPPGPHGPPAGPPPPVPPPAARRWRAYRWGRVRALALENLGGRTGLTLSAS